MLTTFFGLKKEMTQIYSADGKVLPVTIVDLSQTKVLKVAAADALNKVVLIGVGEKKGMKDNKAILKPKFVRTVSLDDVSEIVEGGLVLGESLENKKVMVTGVTKGKGFQGVVKRWGFKGGKRTHGQSDRMRAPGSIASGTTMGRIDKGKKMGGHMGAKNVTIKNLVIRKFDVANSLLLIGGAIPGNRNGLVKIQIL